MCHPPFEPLPDTHDSPYVKEYIKIHGVTTLAAVGYPQSKSMMTRVTNEDKSGHSATRMHISSTMSEQILLLSSELLLELLSSLKFSSMASNTDTDCFLPDNLFIEDEEEDNNSGTVAGMGEVSGGFASFLFRREW